MGIHKKRRLEKKDESFRDWSNIDEGKYEKDLSESVGDICDFLGGLFDKICGRKPRKRKVVKTGFKKSKSLGKGKTSDASSIYCKPKGRVGQSERRH